MNAESELVTQAVNSHGLSGASLMAYQAQSGSAHQAHTFGLSGARIPAIDRDFNDMLAC
jgi:hypothetical protein